MRINNPKYILLQNAQASQEHSMPEHVRKTAFTILMLYGIGINAFITIDISCYDTHAVLLMLFTT